MSGRRRVANLVLAPLLAGVLLLASCSTTTTTASVGTVARPDGFPVGVALGNRLFGADADRIDAALDDVVHLGGNWIRVDMSWESLQPDGPDTYDWAPMDAIVSAARARHLHVLGILTYTPPWARAAGCTTFVCPPADDAAFATFAGAVAARYVGQGVDGYEIWNEPNLPIFWVSPDPTAYAALLRPTVTSVHAAAPSATVITGGLAPNRTYGGAIRADDFLREACGSGACDGVDGVGYHPYTYPQSPEQLSTGRNNWAVMTQSVGDEQSLRDVLSSVGLGEVPLWLTEFGAPTGGPGGVADGPEDAQIAGIDHVTETWQAHIVDQGILLAAADRTQFAAIFVYTLDDLDPGDSPDSTVEDYFGLTRTDGSQKPAYRAFQIAAGRSE